MDWACGRFYAIHGRETPFVDGLIVCFCWHPLVAMAMVHRWWCAVSGEDFSLAIVCGLYVGVVGIDRHGQKRQSLTADVVAFYCS